MPRTDLTKLTKAQLIALIANTATAESEASAHFRARDLACTATPPCTRKDLRTAKRAASHGPEGHFAR